MLGIATTYATSTTTRTARRRVAHQGRPESVSIGTTTYAATVRPTKITAPIAAPRRQ